MGDKKSLIVRDLSVKFAKIESNSAQTQEENNLATAEHFESLVLFDEAGNTIGFNFEDSQIEMKHAGTWHVQVLYQQVEEKGFKSYPLLSFNMIIVTPCVFRKHAAVSLNPDPFVWPLDDYIWAKFSQGEPDEQSSEVD